MCLWFILPRIRHVHIHHKANTNYMFIIPNMNTESNRNAVRKHIHQTSQAVQTIKFTYPKSDNKQNKSQTLFVLHTTSCSFSPLNTSTQLHSPNSPSQPTPLQHGLDDDGNGGNGNSSQSQFSRNNIWEAHNRRRGEAKLAKYLSIIQSIQVSLVIETIYRLVFN